MVSIDLFLFFKNISSGCIYLIKNTVKTVILCNIITIEKNRFLSEHMLKCNLFLWSNLYFQHHYSSLQCHMILRNHYNILICCSRNIYYIMIIIINVALYFCGNHDWFYVSWFFESNAQKNSNNLKPKPCVTFYKCFYCHFWAIEYVLGE